MLFKTRHPEFKTAKALLLEWISQVPLCSAEEMEKLERSARAAAKFIEDAFDPDEKRWEVAREAEMKAFERANPLPDAADLPSILLGDVENAVEIATDSRWRCNLCQNWNPAHSSCIGKPKYLGDAVCGLSPPIFASPDPPRYKCPRCNNVNGFDSLCVAQVDGKMCGFNPLTEAPG